MDLEPDVLSALEHYEPKISALTQEQAAWIVIHDPFLTDAEKSALKRYAGKEKPFPPDTAYGACAGCKKMTEDSCSNCTLCPDCCACQICEKCEERCESVCERCNCCSGDCDCAHCGDCGTPHEHVCENCDGCERHCDCTSCERCGEFIDTSMENYCSYCTRCEGCGHSRYCDRPREEDDDEEEIDLPNIYPSKSAIYEARLPNERTLFNSRRLAGIEVEYNECFKFDPIEKWSNIWGSAHYEDGSCGYECVTAPAAGDFLVSQITELSAAMKSAECKTDKRCGIHVHVDARDLRWTDIYKLIRVYAKVEAALYLIAGQHRSVRPNKQNGVHYCRPNGQDLARAIDVPNYTYPGLKKERVLEAIYSRAVNFKHHKPEKKEDGRYVGMNLLPWVAGRAHHKEEKWDKVRGGYVETRWQTPNADTTIEFRMHRDCIDEKRILGWTKLCVRLVEYAAKATDNEIDSLPDSSMRALCVIAPDLTSFIVGRLKAWRKAVPRSKRRVKYVETHMRQWRNRNEHDGLKYLHRVRSYIFCTPEQDDIQLEERAA